MLIHSKVSSLLRAELLTSRYLRFLTASGASAIVNILLRIELSRSMAYNPSVALAYVFSTLLAFVFNRIFVFSAQGRASHIQLARFFVVNIIGLIQTLVLSNVLSRLFSAVTHLPLQLNETLAHAFALSTLAITSFFLHKNFTFSNFAKTPDSSDLLKPTKRPLNVDLLVAAALVCTWTILASVVHPLGNFALNDDWSYARSVQVLLEQHRVYMDGWTTATFYFQALLGALFCLPTGFSFSALRVSTIVMGGFGIIGLYFLLKQVAGRRDWAAYGAAALMLNPIYFQNSFNFMTDVPYSVLATFACLFFARAFATRACRDELIGFLFLGAASLIRQITLPIALAYGLVVLWRTKLSWQNLVRAFWPAAGVQILLTAYNLFIIKLGIELPLADAKQRQMSFYVSKLGYTEFVHQMLVKIYIVFVYLSVSLLPLTIVISSAVCVRCLKTARERSMRKTLGPITLLAVTFLVSLSINDNCLRFLGNNLYSTMVLGPCDMGANCGLIYPRINPASWLPDFAWNSIFALIVTVTFGLLSAGATVALLRPDPKENSYVRSAAFSLVALISTLIPFALFNVFDRYVIPLVPMFGILLTAAGGLLLSNEYSQSNARQVLLSRTVSLSILMIYGVVAVGGTHDYLAWNRTRWSAISDLMERKHVTPADIEGGFAVTGWNLYVTNTEVRNRYNQQFYGPGRFSMPTASYVIGLDHRTNALGTCVRPHQGGEVKLASYPISGWLLDPRLEIAVFERCHDGGG
ncbi:GtrA family protein [Dyella solisilvae]|nr:GtrA family protein [Dyella solisilvae]